MGRVRQTGIVGDFDRFGEGGGVALFFREFGEKIVCALPRQAVVEGAAEFFSVS
jgi:hypothetical protein